ncbi:ictacalcin-like [Micropterus dolomieu]|uniref:ictacalcin-like n=1 Tax=Micropterus dolomieu TaxID=147949 RepID=UPI001E8E6AAB|nr:ictacalcin-like [Micropterus dolomieu]
MLSSQIFLFPPLDLHKCSYNFANMPGLTNAMALLRATFDKYAGKEGDKETLTKTELSDLLKSEGLGGGAAKKEEVDKFFNALDNDKDGVVDFQEYVTFVAALTVICNQK